MAHVLALDQSGFPQHWISYEDAITYHAKGLVAWSLGDNSVTFHGGTRRVDGEVSTLTTASIIAIKGEHAGRFNRKIQLTNRTLFERDHHLCCYCGRHYSDEKKLSRDHIVPVSKGGKDVWMNVVTACIKCNNHKDNLTLSEAGLELLYVPYVPNRHEEMILKNRKILADQMEFLMQGVPEHSRLHKMKEFRWN